MYTRLSKNGILFPTELGKIFSSKIVKKTLYISMKDQNVKSI